MSEKRRMVEFIESYIKIGNSDYQWDDNHGELIRCKDCKHGCGRGRGMYCQFIECGKTGAFHKEDWFCADGERR